ncbi:hypothetical protein Bca52824_064542 [Brassica carinata]|uniref:2-succinylbenzoate--CoA ligase, chloroplastic/peroxisomal n=1 Tax=Brassica carinata TaxID=52824 RepID=A0A8X7U8P7_BRACI|nr:hypothetical protein Bca52824_064542 [Brassica carinata]
MAMQLVEPVLLVTDEACVSWFIGVQNIDVPSLKWRVLMESTSTDFASEHNQFLTTEMLKQNVLVDSLPTYAWAPDDAVVICFTSGTTGRPKGVTISHLAFITQSLAKIAVVGYGEDDVYLHTSPLVHIGGLSSAMAMLMVGACHVLLPKFDAKTALQVMEQHCVTCFITVPAMMADLVSVNRTTKNGDQNSCVRKILNGGGSLSTELLKDAAKIFPRAKIFSAYGMTEACSSLTFMTLYDPTTQESCKVTYPLVSRPKQGTCVGKPAPHIELRVKLDEDSLRVGKIVTRGPHTMLGYWDGHQVVQENSSGAWLDTGDIGTIDEFGNLWLIGRSSGRIKTGGENVYPEEVEAVLLEHPGIVSAVVIGVMDVRLGEMVVACVRLQVNWIWSDVENHRNRDSELSSEALKHHCRTQNLTGFKIPKRFVRWEKQFPLTTTGGMPNAVESPVCKDDEYEQRLLVPESCGEKSLVLEKAKEIAGLRRELELISKLLSGHEKGDIKTLEDHEGTTDLLRRKVSGKNIGSVPSKPENLEYLRQLPREELINHFKTQMNRLKREHECTMQEMTEEYFSIKRRCLKLEECPSLSSLNKDKDFEKKIPDII